VYRNLSEFEDKSLVSKFLMNLDSPKDKEATAVFEESTGEVEDLRFNEFFESFHLKFLPQN
jgi:hypothetical protein